MYVFAFLISPTIISEGHFVERILAEWANDLEEFVHIKLPHLVVIFAIAFILNRIIAGLTNRMITVADRKDARPGRHSQVKTFAGILRTTLISILWTLTTLQILTIMGFKLGALLASAGVAGIAIGLAAQTIVKDLLNGMLIVLEDQFNVGDVVRLTGMTGSVEAMSLRRTELRDGDGTLYVIPNSQITTVANLSRDYSVATINVSVDFSAPPDKVVKLLTSIANDIRNDKVYSSVFLDNPQVLGVDAINGSQVVYPVIFKTQAMQQYGPVREFRRRVRNALEEQGMLPGDPNRVFREFSGKPDSQLPEPENQPKAGEAKEPPKVDPTTIPAENHNPFTAE